MPLVTLIIYLAVILVFIVSMWKLFEKSGQEGWKSIIPIYNIYVITVEIAKRPAWWVVVICIVPIIGLIFYVIVCMDWAIKFGKSKGYGVGMALLGFIFLPLLAFNKETQFDADAKNDAFNSFGDMGRQQD